jgi:hypothetical protein
MERIKTIRLLLETKKVVELKPKESFHGCLFRGTKDKTDKDGVITKVFNGREVSVFIDAPQDIREKLIEATNLIVKEMING